MVKASFNQITRYNRLYTLVLLSCFLSACGGSSSPSEQEQATIPAISTQPNSAPSAEAGGNKTAEVAKVVQLDGSASSDPEGDELTYQWQITSQPQNSDAKLESTNNINASFVANTTGTYQVTLTIRDTHGNSAQDTIDIIVIGPNLEPIANAGEPQTVTQGNLVLLDGSKSYDPDEDEISYQWQLESIPLGSEAVLNFSTTSTPEFVVDSVGQYQVRLTVNDGELNSIPSYVFINVEPKDVVQQRIATNGTVNILLLIGDDIGVDNITGYSEHPNSAYTPNIDQLAEQGVLFRNTWANAMCSPSRASLLTGRYPSFHGVTHPGGQTGQLSNSEVTIAEQLSEAGYQTALFGKWHLGEAEGVLPTDQGFDFYSGTLGNIRADLGEDYFNWTKTQITGQGGVATQIVESRYATQINTTEASTWIAQQTKPWFVQIAFNAPHSPFHVPPKDKFSSITLNGEMGEECLPSGTLDSDQDCYRAMAESMDVYIGELLDSIDPEVLANTLIVFVGDNGTPANTVINYQSENFFFHRQHSKGTVYEGGVNVPLIISAGTNLLLNLGEVEQLTQIQDLYPTFLALAGAEPKVEIQGKSLLGFLAPEQAEIEPLAFVFSELKTSDNITGNDHKDRWAVSDGKIKFISNEGDEECYDLSTDPAESNNLLQTSNALLSRCEAMKLNKPK